VFSSTTVEFAHILLTVGSVVTETTYPSLSITKLNNCRVKIRKSYCVEYPFVSFNESTAFHVCLPIDLHESPPHFQLSYHITITVQRDILNLKAQPLL